MHNSLTMTRLSGNAMKVFVVLFALLMLLAPAAPAMACFPPPEAFAPETYREFVRKFAENAGYCAQGADCQTAYAFHSKEYVPEGNDATHLMEHRYMSYPA
jgi:hypothetical protein